MLSAAAARGLQHLSIKQYLPQVITWAVHKLLITSLLRLA